MRRPSGSAAARPPSRPLPLQLACLVAAVPVLLQALRASPFSRSTASIGPCHWPRLTAALPLSPALLLFSGSNEPLDTLPSLHAAPVTAMRYNEAADTVISTDGKGVIEYWSAVSWVALNFGGGREWDSRGKKASSHVV